MARIILTVTNNNTGRVSYQGVRHEGAYEDLKALFYAYVNKIRDHYYWSYNGVAFGTPYVQYKERFTGYTYKFTFTLRKN